MLPRPPRAWRRRLSASAIAVLSASAALFGPEQARAQVTADTTLFGVNTGTNVYTVNRLTGAVTQIGTLSFATSALARSPINGNLYYTSNAGTLGRVGVYNPATNTNAIINGTGNGDLVVRLTFDANGVLYGIGDTPTSTLYTIDPTTGAYTTLGPVKIGSSAGANLGGSGDMAFDYDGTLYVIANDVTNGGASLYRISLVPSGGAYIATYIGNSVPTAAQNSLAFVADGRLVSGGVNQTMYVINKSTGAAAQIAGANALQYADFATSPKFANLAITGTSGPIPVGDTAQYTITVSNAGPQSETGQITVVDSLPANFTYLGVTGAGWTCAAVARRVTCTTPGPLANGGTTSLVLKASVGATIITGTSVPNILRVAGSTVDQDQSDNRFVIPGTAVANIDFTLTKTHAGNFTVGTTGVYTLTAKDVGSSPSNGTLTISDTLPAGMVFLSGVGTSWACGHSSTTPDIVTCTRSVAVAAGATTSITLSVSVAQAAAPSQTNVAHLGGGGMIAPPTASDPTTVLYRAVTVTPANGTTSQLPSNGTSYTANFTVTNAGTLADTYTLSAFKVPGTTISITSVSGVAGSTGSVTLGVGANAVIPVVYTVANAALAGAIDSLKLRAVSTASAAVVDTGSLMVTVIRAGLTIAKQLYRSDGTTLITLADLVSPGETVQFLVTVTATGNSGSTAVHVVDPLPPAVSYLSTVPDLPGWTISQSAGTVTADLAGTLATGASRFFWIKVKIQ